MAKARMNVFTELSGSVGEDLTFRRLSMQNKQLLQTKPVPRYTRTEAQNAVRTGYKQACSIWKTASWLDKGVYTDFSKIYNITDFNTFLKFNLPVLTKAPAMFLGLDEGTGTIAHDYSPNGNNGTIYGATWQTLATGKHVLSFDGVDDYIEVANSASIVTTKAWTLMAWVKVVDSATWRGVISKAEANLPAPYDTYVLKGTDEMRFLVGDGTTLQDVLSDTVKFEEWQMWSFRYDGEYITIFTDGEQTADEVAVTVNVADTGNAVYIGNRDDGVTPMSGNIALPTIIPEALTETQIQKIYKATKDLFNE